VNKWLISWPIFQHMFATLGVGTSPEVLVTVADVMSQFSPLSQSSWPPLVVVTAHATMDNIVYKAATLSRY
jgi:hypothetical protein